MQNSSPRGPQAAASPSAAEILAAIRDSPPVAAAIAGATARKVAERQRLVDTLATAEAAAAAAWPALSAEIDVAVAAEQKAEAAWRRAQHRTAAAAHARTAASVALDRTRNQIEAALVAGADETVISAFAEWIEEEIGRVNRQTLPGDAITRREGGEQVTIITTNRASVLGRLAALRDARGAVEGLRMIPDQATVLSRIAEIRAALPPVTEATSVTRRRIERPDDRQFGVRAA